MMRYIHFSAAWWLLLLLPMAWADTRIDAQWEWARNETDPDASVLWSEFSGWVERLSAELTMQQEGFGMSARLNERELVLQDLYVEFATERADWTLGRKPQEWAFAYGDSELNRIDEQIFVMREQYLALGQWQLACLYGEVSAQCLSRLSGWQDAWDWQLLAGYGQDVWVGLGLQRQIGLGGLVYGELVHQQQASQGQLQALAPSVYQLVMADTPLTEWQLGAQWSSASGLTLHWQSHWQDSGLARRDWQRIREQLTTAQAGLIATAYQQSMRQQHWLRVEQSWQAWRLENTSVYWPEALDSWMNQTHVNLQINDTLSATAQWQHHVAGSVFRDIGSKDEWVVRVEYVDGF